VAADGSHGHAADSVVRILDGTGQEVEVARFGNEAEQPQRCPAQVRVGAPGPWQDDAARRGVVLLSEVGQYRRQGVLVIAQIVGEACPSNVAVPPPGEL
jgi:hypothetical protein